jgi:hypothetical protein
MQKAFKTRTQVNNCACQIDTLDLGLKFHLWGYIRK